MIQYHQFHHSPLIVAGPVLNILIPTYNRTDYLRHNLECLNGIKSSDILITVVDNNTKGVEWPELMKAAPANSELRINYANFTANVNFLRALSVSSCEYMHLLGDDDLLLSCYSELPHILRHYRADIVSFDPEATDLQETDLRSYIRYKARDPLLFNNLWHITTFIYSSQIFSVRYGLRHVNSVYPHAWGLLGPLLTEPPDSCIKCLVLPQSEYIDVSYFSRAHGRPTVDLSEDWNQAYLEKAFQCSLFTLWCKTFKKLIDDAYDLEYLRYKYCKRIASVFPGAFNYLFGVIEYNEAWF